MKAIGKGNWKTIVEAPKGATRDQLEKKARNTLRVITLLKLRINE